MTQQIDFIIIGAMKSGTTTLASFLDLHPDVSFCRIKEPNFFLPDSSDYQLGSSYHLFSGPGIKGEAST